MEQGGDETQRGVGDPQDDLEGLLCHSDGSQTSLEVGNV
jgi:hypothetical protein